MQTSLSVYSHKPSASAEWYACVPAGQWVAYCLTAVFALLLCSFIALLSLSLLLAAVSLLEAMLTWNGHH